MGEVKMSRTYDLACTDCKKAIWIGQYGGGSGHIYTGNNQTMRLLNDFLWEHSGHSLIFVDDEILDDDYEEMVAPGWFSSWQPGRFPIDGWVFVHIPSNREWVLEDFNRI